jgi:hypothetical protein
MHDSIPADRVYAPNPLSLFEQPARPAMAKVRLMDNLYAFRT